MASTANSIATVDLAAVGDAGLVVLGLLALMIAVIASDKAALKAEKQIAKELDVSPGDVDAAIQKAGGEIS